MPDVSHYPIAPDWFSISRVDESTDMLMEPHVHVLEQANMFFVRGSDRDMIIDTGMGIVPIAPYVDPLSAKPHSEIICVSTHTHIDHIGGVHEFDTRLVHPIEADEMASPSIMNTIIRDEIDPVLLELFASAGYPPLDELLITALPHEGYDPATYALKGAPATGLLEEGDTVDLGDRQFTVLHVPGHSPGSIALFEEKTGILFAGDAIYDGPLIYDGPGMSVDDYVVTMKKLQALDVTIVHGGHDPSFGKKRLDEIVEKYFRIWGA
ncbi:MAG: MBL fold metallo-hydrolase [Roseibium sp.]|uniref:MBL fold metallo-hydrolase n=1 Tax=Roseibium sp. TaxID=1936156 RepID=UPI003D9C072F